MSLKRKRVKWIVFVLAMFFGVHLAWSNRYDLADWFRAQTGWKDPEDPRPAGMSKLEWAEKNYSESMRIVARQTKVPYEYLMALVVLECGGDKPAGSRFESHVYHKLKNIRERGKGRYEKVRHSDLATLNEKQLRELATSWGPFQLMGYKSVAMETPVSDLHDEKKSLHVGAKWIAEEYGHFIRKKKYRDAFHYHNTGKRFPLDGRSRTHNPYYVSNGLKYMEWFRKREEQRKRNENAPHLESAD